jgi:hypothetical protein
MVMVERPISDPLLEYAVAVSARRPNVLNL